MEGTDDVAGFSCGDAVLDDFLTGRALADQHAGKTRVAARDAHVVGYFALKAATVSPPTTIAHVSGQGPLDIPVILLERMAVEADEQGKGIGEAMLVQALSRCLHASSTMFSRAVLVDAGAGGARGFFEKYGFASSPTGAQHLLLRYEGRPQELDAALRRVGGSGSASSRGRNHTPERPIVTGS